MLLLLLAVMATLGACAPAATPAPNQRTSPPKNRSRSPSSCPAPSPMLPSASRCMRPAENPNRNGRHLQDWKSPIPRTCSRFRMPLPPFAIMPPRAMTSSSLTAPSTAPRCSRLPRISPRPALPGAPRLDTFQKDGINNVFAYQAEAQQGGYVQGVIAAMMSKSGCVGICGPVEAGDAKLYVDGFKAGVWRPKPDAKVNVTYTGSFSDVSLMAAAAETQIKAGRRYADRLLTIGGWCDRGWQRQEGPVVWHPVGPDLPGPRRSSFPARSMTGPVFSKTSSPAARQVCWATSPTP